MSRKRWMAAVVAEAKKSEGAVTQALPFTRQARMTQKLQAAETPKRATA